MFRSILFATLVTATACNRPTVIRRTDGTQVTGEVLQSDARSVRVLLEGDIGSTPEILNVPRDDIESVDEQGSTLATVGGLTALLGLLLLAGTTSTPDPLGLLAPMEALGYISLGVGTIALVTGASEKANYDEHFGPQHRILTAGWTFTF